MAKKYKKSKWAGLDKFDCNECMFNTLDEEKIIQHIKDYHEPKPRKSKILDSKGEQIILK